MPKSSGFRRKTRSLLTRKHGSRSGPIPDIYLRDYRVGDRVVVIIEPSVHRGMPHRRYNGLVGRILERRGRGYILEVFQGDKPKKISVMPDHIRPLVEA
ncbi:MAG: 50S ribosomal protein L21e [Nitrososphaerota archaeon]